MSVLEIVAILLALQFKHFLGDFAFQTQNMVRNKGIYGHRDGLAHSAIHGALSVVALLLVWQVSVLVLIVAAVETVVHYHIDWLKEQVTKGKAWQSDNSRFWIAVGFDQFLHQTTYVVMLAYFLSR